jgi:DNA-binding NarL/FixJ family response regulator
MVPTSSAPQGPEPTAIVAAGDEETRVLLRGLLRLHHFRVDGEAEGASQALALLRTHRPGLLLADVNLAEGSPAALVADARAIVPALRVILVAPSSRPPPVMGVGGQGPDVVLLRPFRIRQFAEAVCPSPATTETAARAA